MRTKNYLCGILVAMSIARAADPTETTVVLHADIEEILERTRGFSEKGYTEEADSMARQTTNQLLTTLADRVATQPEIDAMVDAHLKTELYYAFNTQWGSGKTKDHRITYDFLSHLDKSVEKDTHQKEHLTKITTISLAAQEYFWNEKSTVDDLRNRVKRELRYGFFKKTGHKLDISNLVYLDEENLNRIANESISDTVFGKLEALLSSFKMKSLGSTYAALFDNLTTVLNSVASAVLPFDIAPETIEPFGLTTSMELNPVPSLGDGMCGEHSIFIPTDGALDGIQEGNGRYKIHRAILDNSTDSEAKRLYLRASNFMDGTDFINFINRQIAELRLVNSAQQADELQTRLDAYQVFMVDKRVENESSLTQFKKNLLTEVTLLPKLESSLTILNAAINTPDQLAACSNAGNFRNIIDEIILLRTASAELNRLLTPIDANILRLNADAKNEEKVAALAASTARAEAEKIFNVAKADFEQFQGCNIALVQEHQALLMKQQQLVNFIENPSVTPEALQAAKDSLERTNKEFIAFEAKNPQFVKDITDKNSALLNAHKNYHAIKENYAAKDAKLAEKYTLIGNTLKDFISINMLPGRSEHAFSVDALCSAGYGNFVNGVCQEVCTIAGDGETEIAIRKLWDEFDGVKEVLAKQTDQQLLSQRLEIAASLPVLPAELSPDALMLEMEKLALREGELDGWLPCDAPYTQLWAIINNLNIFVFSSGEAYGRTPLDVMTRLKDRPYDSMIMPYPQGTTGKHLATVILTSPTAKNIFLDKSPNHYDKFILPNDYAAIAREIRHVAWTKLADRYASYP